MEGNLIYDYLVFGALILGSISVAFYGRFSGPKEKTKNDYAFASKSNMFTMMLSIARGFLGVRVFLGYPSELFYRGSSMWEILYGMIIAYPVVCFFFVPVYYNLSTTSVYQYLDLRFKSRLVRCLASGTYVFRSILNLGVTVFTPCVALKTVIGLPYWASILAIVAISIFFVMMGGLRTAILADVVQLLVMLSCSMAVLIQGTISAGGVVNVVNASYQNDRLDFFNFDMDPTIRVTTVSAIIGQLFMSLSIFGCQQNFVQRYCSMSSQKKVTQTLMANIPIMTFLFSISWIVGMVIYANYANCDPRALGYISSIDEILPFYVEDKFYFMPGFLGLVMACLFNGALNLLVSNLNSLAIVMWEDFFFLIPACKGFSESAQLWFIKGLGAVCGLMIMGTAFVVAMLSGVIEASMLMTSATSGPLLGVFLLAMFCPPANWKGAAVGMITSHAIVMWITFGHLTVERPPIPLLPVSVDGCTNTTFSPNIPPLPHHSDPVWTEDFDIDPVVNPAAHDKLLSAEVFKACTESLLIFLPFIGLHLCFWLIAPYLGRVLEILIMVELLAITKGSDFVTSLYLVTYMYYSLFGTLITVSIGLIVSIITRSDEDTYDEKLVHPWARKFYKWLPGRKKCFVNMEETPTSAHTVDCEKYKSKTNRI